MVIRPASSCPRVTKALHRGALRHIRGNPGHQGPRRRCVCGLLGLRGMNEKKPSEEGGRSSLQHGWTWRKGQVFGTQNGDHSRPGR